MDKDQLFKIFIMLMVGLLVLALFYYGIKYIFCAIFRPEFRPELNKSSFLNDILSSIIEGLSSKFGPVVYRIFNLLLGLFSLSIGILSVYAFWKLYAASH